MKYSVGSMMVILSLCAALFAPVAAAQVWRVDQSAAGAGDGSTWADAFTTIQPAIDAAWAAGGGEVWVAGGPPAAPVIYGEARTEPWGAGNYQGSLVMKDNVAVLGGFEGWRGGAGVEETDATQRVLAQNVAVIDGSTSRGGSAAYHVVVFGRLGDSTVNARLDGFVIRGGNAAGDGVNYHTYRGGGIYNWQSAPDIFNCIIENNTAAVSGGGAANESSPFVTANARYGNCIFRANSAQRGLDYVNNPARGGGGLFINKSAPFLAHVTFDGNSVIAGGAAPGNLTNYGVNAGSIYNYSGAGLPATQPQVEASILWNSSNPGIVNETAEGGAVVSVVANYSNIRGGYVGAANINTDPLFSGAAPFASQATAALCRDVTTTPVAQDVRGVPRPLNFLADMGAYEYSANGPVAVCTDFTVNLDASCAAAMDDDNIDGGSTAEAGIWKIEADQTAFTGADAPSTAVTLTVTDILGRTNTCSATVYVQDAIEPVASCQDVTVYLSAPTLSATAIDGGSTDNCAIAAWLIDGNLDKTFTCADLGATAVVLEVQDAAGNSDTCPATVTVVDDVAPVIALAGDNPETVECGSAYADAGATALDDCEGDLTALMTVVSTVDAAVPGSYTITYDVADSLGNVATQVVRNVEVVDAAAPVITLAGASSVTVECGTSYTDAGASADDACVGGLTPTAVSTVDVNLVGSYTVTYTVSDGNGNDATPAVRNVEVEDTRAPVITRRGNALVYVSLGDTYTDEGADATDLCDGDITGDIATVNPVDGNVEGTYTVTYNVSDGAGNPAAQVTRTVIVADTSAPDVINVEVESELTVLLTYNKNMQGGLGVLVAANYAVSGSGVGTLNVNPDSVDEVTDRMYRLTWLRPNEMFHGGDIVITVDPSVEDPDTVPMRQNVGEDTGGALGEAPVLTLNGSDETLECGVDSFSEAGASAVDDVDGTVAVVIGGDVVNSNATGVYVVTYTATDAAGNSASDSRTVTVEDNTNPDIALNGDASVLLECNLVFYTEEGATAWDACEGDLTSEVVIGGDVINTSALGLQTVTYTVMDSNGHEASASRTIEVVDTTAPIIALVGPNPLVLPDGTGYVEPGYSAWDACEGDVTGAVLVTGDDPNTSDLGVYLINYAVSDSQSNATLTVRTVVVKPEDCALVLDLSVTPNPATPGEEVTFQVTELAGSCSVGALSYNWQKASGGKADFMPIPGAPDAPLFVIPAADFDDAGIYKCTVSDAADSYDSPEVVLYVGSGVPAAGIAGMMLAAALAALTGARAVRKRR